MKKLSFAIVGAAALALAACGGKGDDALGDNVADNYEAAADNLEMMADNTANGAEADALENQADALEATGDAKEDAIDDADTNAANVNAMGGPCDRSRNRAKLRKVLFITCMLRMSNTSYQFRPRLSWSMFGYQTVEFTNGSMHIKL